MLLAAGKIPQSDPVGAACFCAGVHNKVFEPLTPVDILGDLKADKSQGKTVRQSIHTRLACIMQQFSEVLLTDWGLWRHQEAVCTNYGCEVKAAACDSWAPHSSRASSYQPLSPPHSLQSTQITLVCWLLLLGAANAVSTDCTGTLRSAALTVVVSQLAGLGDKFCAEECHPIPKCAAALCEHCLDGQVAAAGMVDEAGHIACSNSSKVPEWLLCLTAEGRERQRPRRPLGSFSQTALSCPMSLDF